MTTEGPTANASTTLCVVGLSSPFCVSLFLYLTTECHHSNRHGVSYQSHRGGHRCYDSQFGQPRFPPLRAPHHRSPLGIPEALEDAQYPRLNLVSILMEEKKRVSNRSKHRNYSPYVQVTLSRKAC